MANLKQLSTKRTLLLGHKLLLTGRRVINWPISQQHCSVRSDGDRLAFPAAMLGQPDRCPCTRGSVYAAHDRATKLQNWYQ